MLMRPYVCLCALLTAAAIGGTSNVSARDLFQFDIVTVDPAFELRGHGSDVDSLAFWEAPTPSDTLLFVTAKDGDLIQVWQYPFVGNELPPIEFPANVNGLVVDQETDRLYVSDKIISVFSIPSLQMQGDLGDGAIGIGENNLDLFRHRDGRTLLYVSDDHNVHVFDTESKEKLTSFSPSVSSIETVLADDFYQVIYVPEEQGPEGNPGVYAYHPTGNPFEKNGTNRFGNDGEFDSDEEGVLLYTFPTSGEEDDGTGFIVVADQRKDVTEFELFDRQTWAHLGTVRINGVSNTDGIASTQRALPDYPMGLLVAVNNDKTTVGIGWHAVFDAIGWDVTSTPSMADPPSSSRD